MCIPVWPGKGGGGGGGGTPAFWPGSGGAGGGAGKPGVGTGTVTVTTLVLASSRSLDSFSICREVETQCVIILFQIISLPHVCEVVVHEPQHQ